MYTIENCWLQANLPWKVSVTQKSGHVAISMASVLVLREFLGQLMSWMKTTAITDQPSVGYYRCICKWVQMLVCSVLT